MIYLWVIGLKGGSVAFMIIGPLMSFLAAVVFEVKRYENILVELMRNFCSLCTPGAGLVDAQILNRFLIWTIGHNSMASLLASQEALEVPVVTFWLRINIDLTDVTLVSDDTKEKNLSDVTLVIDYVLPHNTYK